MKKIFKIEKTVVTKVPDYEVTIDLPTEPTFYQSFNYRRMIALIPQLNLETNVPYQYICYKIENDTISRLVLNVSEFETIQKRRKENNKSDSINTFTLQVLDILFDNEYENTVKKDFFFEQYNRKKQFILKDLEDINV